MATATKPRISVVVATRNRRDRLERLLAALAAQTLDPAEFETIVVDSASSDGTRELLHRIAAPDGAKVTAVLRNVNEGPAAARNEGWRRARGELIAFTDDDCEPSRGWLEAGIRAWGGEADRFVQGRTRPNPRELDELGLFSRTMRVEGPTPHYPTCNVFYPRALLERLCGFDAEAYAFWGEDTDLAWRAIDAGARPVFAADALVDHAVNQLGPIGRLRLAASWGPAMRPYALHARLRREAFIGGVFWKREHLLLVIALLCLVPLRTARLPGPLVAALRGRLLLPYARSVYGRCVAAGRGPEGAPYIALCDVLELIVVARAGRRYRTLIL